MAAVIANKAAWVEIVTPLGMTYYQHSETKVLALVLVCRFIEAHRKFPGSDRWTSLPTQARADHPPSKSLQTQNQIQSLLLPHALNRKPPHVSRARRPAARRRQRLWMGNHGHSRLHCRAAVPAAGQPHPGSQLLIRPQVCPALASKPARITSVPPVIAASRACTAWSATRKPTYTHRWSSCKPTPLLVPFSVIYPNFIRKMQASCVGFLFFLYPPLQINL